MRPGLLIGVLVAALSLSGSAATPHQIWFCPGPGTLDFIRLFDRPNEWRRARDVIDVFKFYQQHTQSTNPAFAPNTYQALSNANAFRMIKSWGKKLAIEVGVVKDFYCDDANGVQHAIDDTLNSVRAVQNAGGTVDYLTMDDPFASGKLRVCGGPSLEPTVDRISGWMRGVQGAVPLDRIGWIEAYPFSSAAEIETAWQMLRDRGTPPKILHMDVDLNAIRAPASDFARDIRRLRDFCQAQNIRFGIIFWGNNADADVLYALDAERLVNATASTFTGWDDMPEHLIVQSWAQTRSGLWITPSNLPEDRPFAHTRMLIDIVRRLRGETGAASGTAIRR